MCIIVLYCTLSLKEFIYDNKKLNIRPSCEFPLAIKFTVHGLCTCTISNLLHIYIWYTIYYSNLAYSLLGRCLVQEFDPHTTFEKYVQQNILDPLNMTNTGFDYTRRYILCIC